MYWIRRICVTVICLLLVSAAGVVTVLRHGGLPTGQEQTPWTPFYIQTNPNSAGMPNTPARETRYEELRPEQLAMILPRERPYWMKAQGYTSFTWGEFGLAAYSTRIYLDLETRLQECHIDFSAQVITQDMLDMMSEVKEIEDPSVSVCHGVEFHIYEYVDDTFFNDDVTLDARGRINNCHCTFLMRVPKGDEELLQQAKLDFERVLESFSLAGQTLDWHSIVPRFSHEYETKELTYGEALVDNAFGEYVQQIRLCEELMFYKFTRSTFYKSDELEIVFTDGEDTVEFTFNGLYGYGYEEPIEPGQQTQWSTPVYAAEDVTEDLLRSCLTEDSGHEVGIRFSDKLLWVEGSEQYVPWMYEQITQMYEQTKLQ